MPKIKRLSKNLGFILRVASANVTGARYPLSVTFISTYRCNFRCEYCDVWTYKEDELSTSEVKAMIDELAGLGMRRFSFNGGEPLLRADIGELISYCRQKGVFTTMFTNGSLLAKNVGKLKDLDILAVSLDGPKEIHERHRLNASFDSAIEGIKAAKAAGMTVWTNTVITRDTGAHIDALVDIARVLGVRMIFQPVLFYPHSSDTAEITGLAAQKAEYVRLIERLKELKKAGAPIMHSDEYLDYIKVPVWSENKRKCWAGRLYCAITPSGNVAPCYPLFNSKKWPSGRELGYGKAFKSIGRFGCNGCYCALVESDFLYSFKPGAVLNLLEAMEAV